MTTSSSEPSTSLAMIRIGQEEGVSTPERVASRNST
jgi:hypothetical protein